MPPAAPLPPHPLARRSGRAIAWPRPALVMGIVNINDDSFSGDGTLDVEEALQTAQRMIDEGAEIIDVGAESARTNRKAISAEEEIARLLPFIEAFGNLERSKKLQPAGSQQLDSPLLSINTWRPEVVAAVLPHGGDLLNDIGGLPDDQNARLCAQYGASLLIMHSVGEPKIPHTSEAYRDVWEELLRFFEDKISMAERAGLGPGQLVLDPGIDFAKQREDNLRVYNELERLIGLGHPVLLPVSRKTVIGDVLGIAEPQDRDAGTLACVSAGLRRGAHIFRVHDVAGTTRALRVLQEIV